MSEWAGVPITVLPGETIEISYMTPIPDVGQALAEKMTKELVDKIMIDDIKMEEVEKNQPYYRSPRGMSLGVPAARKIWEDQIIREIEPDEESPALQTLRNKMRQEILTSKDEKSTVQSVHIPTGLGEFADLDKSVPTKTVKKAAKTKVLKV